jgi:hypothetical protein
MKRHLTVLLFLFAPGLLLAQARPLTQPFEIAPPQASPYPTVSYYHYGPTAVDLGPQGFAVAWATAFRTTDPQTDLDRVSNSTGGLWLDRQGRPGGRFLASTEIDSDSRFEPPLLARDGTGFVSGFCQWRYQGTDVWFRRFGGPGQAIDDDSRLLGDAPDERIDCYPALAANERDRFAVAWVRGAWPPPSTSSSLFLQLFDAAGAPVTPEIEVAAESAGAPPAVGMTEVSGAVVLWNRNGGGIQGMHYDSEGVPLAGPFQISATGDSVAMVMQPGGFVATWKDGAQWARRFTAGGMAVGPAVKIHPSGLQDPALAADRFGNLAVFWTQGLSTSLALFNDLLVPQGPVISRPRAALLTGYHDRGGVALGDDGRILTVWLGLQGTRKRESIQGRLWQARKDDDLCVFRGDRFLCDTAGDGKTAELRLTFGRPGDVPLVGDIDGDGRSDLCIYRDHRFRCDTVRSNAFVGETSRVWFVPAGVQLLLADVDNEEGGGADPCYRQGRHWVCQVWNPIVGLHTISWDFGRATDQAMLGDVDGDGDADPCVYRNGRFLCQAWQEAEGRYLRPSFDLRQDLDRLGLRNGTALLGDVDGDGRADPCVYKAGQLACGLFPRGASQPERIVTLTFGVAGDVPLLGNVDAF